jgi:hypothetical protein
MSLYWVWSYLVAFWSTVVVNCAHPVNWENCWPIHEWLIPYVHDYVDARDPYAKERKILESLEESDGLGRLDGGQAKP